jgi:hypothetical protein
MATRLHHHMVSALLLHLGKVYNETVGIAGDGSKLDLPEKNETWGARPPLLSLHQRQRQSTSSATFSRSKWYV